MAHKRDFIKSCRTQNCHLANRVMLATVYKTDRHSFYWCLESVSLLSSSDVCALLQIIFIHEVGLLHLILRQINNITRVWKILKKSLIFKKKCRLRIQSFMTLGQTVPEI